MSRKRRSTSRAASPVDDFGFVNFESVIVVRGEAGDLTDGAVDVEHGATGATDEMVVVVADTVLVASCRTSWLDPPDEVLVDEDAERVVDRLARDCPELRSDLVAEFVGGGVWAVGDDSQDCQPLSGHLHSVLAQEFFRRVGHDFIQAQILDSVNN